MDCDPQTMLRAACEPTVMPVEESRWLPLPPPPLRSVDDTPESSNSMVVDDRWLHTDTVAGTNHGPKESMEHSDLGGERLMTEVQDAAQQRLAMSQFKRPREQGEEPNDQVSITAASSAGENHLTEQSKRRFIEVDQSFELRRAMREERRFHEEFEKVMKSNTKLQTQVS